MRAQRKVGELTSVMEKAHHAGPGRGKTKSEAPTLFSQTKAAALSEVGITKQQASDWEALAKVPQKQFDLAMEEARESGVKPSVAAITGPTAGAPSDVVDDRPNRCLRRSR